MWLVLDLNSYFASVEQQEDPECRGHPLVVVPSAAPSATVLASSVEAKPYGIKTGTLLGEALKLYPGLVLKPIRHEVYTDYHERIQSLLETVYPVEAVMSVDEFAFKLTGTAARLENALNLCRAMKAVLREKLGECIRCSIGLAPNQLLAKVASDLMKPDGLVYFLKENLPDVLHGLNVNVLPGVGKKTVERLRQFNIQNIEDLSILTEVEMARVFQSVVGNQYYRWLRGEDFRRETGKNKSIGAQHVLVPTLRNRDGAIHTLKRVLSEAGRRLRKNCVYARHIVVWVDFKKEIGPRGEVQTIAPFKISKRLQEIQTEREVWKLIESDLERLPLGTPIRCGAVFTDLIAESSHQPALFKDEKHESIQNTIDKLNQRFGKTAIDYGIFRRPAKADDES